MGLPSIPKRASTPFARLIKDYQSEFSLINLVTPVVRQAIEAVPEELVNISEEELLERVPNPDNTTLQIRNMFWLEYDRARETRHMMDINMACVGVCAAELFYKYLLDPKKVAWIINPPRSYTADIDLLHTKALQQMYEIINLPNMNEHGFIDSKLLDIKNKIFMALDMRKHGGFVQRSMQITENRNVNTNTSSIAASYSESVGDMPDIDIDQKLKILEEEIASKQSALSKTTPEFHSENVLMTKQGNRVDRTIIETQYAEFSESEEKPSE